MEATGYDFTLPPTPSRKGRGSLFSRLLQEAHANAVKLLRFCCSIFYCSAVRSLSHQFRQHLIGHW